MLKNKKFHHLNENELKSFDEYESEDDSCKSDCAETHIIPFAVHYSKEVIKMI